MEQIDVAPTIARILGFPFRADGAPVEKLVSYGLGSARLSLLIVDALGYQPYLAHERSFEGLAWMGRVGKLLKCKVNAYKTTPAIASILCGMKPKAHKVYRTGDVYKRPFKSVLEAASAAGVKSAVAMEEKGALTFEGRIDVVKPVKDEGDALAFDEAVKRGLLEALREGCGLSVAHLRALDKLGYASEAVRSVDTNVLEVAKALGEGGLVMVCGDHPPHGSRERYTPLIAYKLQA